MSALVLASAATSASGVVWFVKPGAAGAGTSWANPIDLQGALAAAAAGDEIRVAAGTYKPGAARNSTFLLNGETLRGGYPAAGGAVADPVANPTILSGDIGVAGMAADNCYHVVWSWGGIIDGFIIRGGNADGLGGGGADSIYGGGLYIRGGTIIDRCKIVRNRAHSGGGAYYFTNQPGSGLTVLRSTIVDNDAFGAAGAPAFLGNGGGILTESQEGAGALIMNRCSVLGNICTGSGGGVNSLDMSIDFQNTVFSGNSAMGGPGGGVQVASLAGPGLGTIFNCTFASNHANYGLGTGGASLSHIWLVNSILWGNTAAGGPVADRQVYGAVMNIEYCDIEGWAGGGAGNISGNPFYVDELGADGMAGTEDDDVRLKSLSPCRDAGRNSEAAIPSDRDGGIRIRQSKLLGGSVTVDMGAYEHPIVTLPGVGLTAPIAPGHVK
ncbi:MAG: hypothetical protein IT436_12415 [Phycisphaerales bacterium]|nr:hypothetical protein [Phycisphaerales bacterium]